MRITSSVLRRVGRIRSSQGGFTLVEMLVGISIMTVTMSLLGGAIFQTVSIQSYWVDEVKATRDLRNAGTWFARDALNAEDVLDPGTSLSLTNGGAAIATAKFTYTNRDDECLESTYSINGSNELVRTVVAVTGVYCATPTINTTQALAVNVLALSFSRVDATVTMTLEVQSEEGNTEVLTYESHMRRFTT